MEMATRAERTTLEEIKIKVEKKPTKVEREPENEDTTATASSSADVPPTEDEVAKLKCEEATSVDDVDMECDEAAEDFGASDEGEDNATSYYGVGSETTPVREYPEEYAKYQIPEKDAVMLSSGMALSPIWGGKRKRSDDSSSGRDDSMEGSGRGLSAIINSIDFGKALPVTKVRKGSSDFLRKGQWTPTEERLARLLIEAFEEGYLPIYTGIRLRGYLAVQLQCDPMRVSKKLCAGSIDGKKIPKNYGQKKFRLRKKLLWDREEAGRILATLERLTKELWCETGIPPPQYLTLSTTRNAEDESSPTSTAATGRTQPSPVKKLSPPANKSKKQKTGVVFPIIYLNLSKKMKQGQSNCGASQNGGNGSSSVVRQYESPYVQNPDGSLHVVGYSVHPNDSDSSSTSSFDGHSVKVDGESLQAAYELLHLHQHCSSPSGSSTSRCSTPVQTHTSADEGHHTQKQQQDEQNHGEEEKMPHAQTNTMATGVVPIRPAPAKPTILRQQAPTVSS